MFREADRPQSQTGATKTEGPGLLESSQSRILSALILTKKKPKWLGVTAGLLSVKALASTRGLELRKVAGCLFSPVPFPDAHFTVSVFPFVLFVCFHFTRPIVLLPRVGVCTLYGMGQSTCKS